MKYKKIDTAINHAKRTLINRACHKGLYENFGQREVRQIQEQYINISDYSQEMNKNRDKLQSFSNWCMNYTGQ